MGYYFWFFTFLFGDGTLSFVSVKRFRLDVIYSELLDPYWRGNNGVSVSVSLDDEFTVVEVGSIIRTRYGTTNSETPIFDQTRVIASAQVCLFDNVFLMQKIVCRITEFVCLQLYCYYLFWCICFLFVFVCLQLYYNCTTITCFDVFLICMFLFPTFIFCIYVLTDDRHELYNSTRPPLRQFRQGSVSQITFPCKTWVLVLHKNRVKSMVMSRFIWSEKIDVMGDLFIVWGFPSDSPQGV